MSIDAITSGVKPGGVSTTTSSNCVPEKRVDLADELDRDDARVVGPPRREQRPDARSCVDEEVLELLGVERALGEGEVVDRLLRAEAHAEGDVAELEVEVDDDGALARFLERDREVRRDERLAGAALRAEHDDQPAGAPRSGLAPCRPRDHLLDREPDLVAASGAASGCRPRRPRTRGGRSRSATPR